MSGDVKELLSRGHKSTISSLSVDLITGGADNRFPAGMAWRGLEEWISTGKVAGTFTLHLSIPVQTDPTSAGYVLLHGSIQ